MHRILLADRDPLFVKGARTAFRDSGYEVTAASSGEQALRQSRSRPPDVALINCGLTVGDSGKALRELREHAPQMHCLLVLDAPDQHAVIDVCRLGACGYLQKPLSGDEMVQLVQRTLTLTAHDRCPGQATEGLVPHALMRWCEAVIDFIASPCDAKNLVEFGKAVGVSSGGFRNWCRTAALSPRASLRFARALRAVAQQHRASAPQNLLKIVDLRTLAKFLKASGGGGDRLPATVEEFLEHQQFVQNREVLSVLRRALAKRRWPEKNATPAPALLEPVSRRVLKRGAVVLLSGGSHATRSGIAIQLFARLERTCGMVLRFDLDSEPQLFPLDASTSSREASKQLVRITSEVTQRDGIAICSGVLPAGNRRLELRTLMERSAAFLSVQVFTPSADTNEVVDYADDVDGALDVDVKLNMSTMTPEEASEHILRSMISRDASAPSRGIDESQRSMLGSAPRS